ncbi:MAG TPA: sulfite exporter TauE/SafE family protein [Phycisphaerae bacterium]|nr:sulfite exporter TauE/SafE family protein [Phycisphaerae bacterium]
MTTLTQSNVAVIGRWLGQRLAARRLRIGIWLLAVVAATFGIAVSSKVGPMAGLLPGTMGVLAIFGAALVCEFIDSSLGMGYGTTLTPLLLLAGFHPLQIVPAVLMSEFATGLLAAVFHHRDGNVDFVNDTHVRRTALLLSLLSGAGAILAVCVALSLPKTLLTGIISGIVLAMGVIILATTHRRIRYRPANIVALGAVAAFNKGLSGGGYGPLVTSGQVLSGLSPKQAVAVTSLAESVTCLIGLLAYTAARTFFGSGEQDWSLALPLTCGACLSVPMSTLVVRAIPGRVLRLAVGVATCLLALLAFGKLLLI